MKSQAKQRQGDVHVILPLPLLVLLERWRIAQYDVTGTIPSRCDAIVQVLGLYLDGQPKPETDEKRIL